VRFVLQPSDPDIFITDEAGRDVYWVKGPTGRVGCWTLRDLADGEVATIRQHGGPFLPHFGIYQHERPLAELRERPDRHWPRAAAALRNALAGAPPRTRYTLDVAGQAPLRIDSDAMALEYAFTREGRPAATVSAYWLAPSGTWGVTVTVADERAGTIRGLEALGLRVTHAAGRTVVGVIARDAIARLAGDPTVVAIDLAAPASPR